jgi:uncharacterized protein (DUF1499 family)
MTKEERKVGLDKDKFYPCPEKHVCVSTHANENDIRHYIEPIKYNISFEKAKSKIKEIVNSLKRTQLLEDNGNYLRFQFTTGLLRFKDDVEFLFDDTEKKIHFKSQSRIGGYDWGTNRNRMEKIRKLFIK